MKKQHILDRLEGPKLPMGSLEQIEREYAAWNLNLKKVSKEELREFLKLAATVTGVVKYPEKGSSFGRRTPADIEMGEAFSLLLLGAWKAHQANALRVAEDIEVGREETYGPFLVFEE